MAGGDKDQQQVLEAYRMFAKLQRWLRRMEEDTRPRSVAPRRLSKRTISLARAGMGQASDAYLRQRWSDLDA